MAVDPTTVTLPPELLPSDGRFGSGPSKLRPETARALADAGADYLGTSHRREGVRGVVRAVREGLSELFALPDGYEVVMGTGGSTAFWDAAAFGLVERRAEHLVFGEFSSKFAAVSAGAPFLDDPLVVESEPGTHPDLVADPSVDTYAFPQNETSTGVMMDVRRVAGADGIMLVDATSSAGGMRVDPTQFDVYYFAPQKAFAADAGIWLALCSPAAVERIERVAATDRWVPPSLSLPIALENSRLDQTYNTPPLAAVYLVAGTLRWRRDQGGLDWAASRCDRSAEIVYGWAEASEYATPFVAKPSERSRTTATIDFVDSVDAKVVTDALRANGIVD